MYFFHKYANLKPEALVREYSKRTFFLKNLQNSLEKNCVHESIL